MDFKDYINTVSQKYELGNATEHTYRGALESLIAGIIPDLLVTNEAKREKCGAPDYIISRSDGQPVFYMEAKDIGDRDLDGHGAHKPQFTRYKDSLDHIIFTDYLDFHFYEYGEWVENIRIGEVCGESIVLCEDYIDKFRSSIQRFANSKVQAITSASRLAEIMAAKARLLRIGILQAMKEQDESYDNKQLRQLFDAFKDALIKDLDEERFSDMYAQTIAYGLFAARLHDTTPEDFSRTEAVNLIPKSNPFLRQIFNSIAGIDLDDRVTWIVDDLVQIFAVTNVQKLMRQYGRNKRHNDPMIHFYEDFLKAYDPTTRERLGVFYTPQPVVSFIVRVVNDLLKRDFDIAKGLASKEIVYKDVIKPQEYDNRTKDGFKHVQKPYHRVQILDPATGTGTFLAEVINTIYDEVSRKNAGMWQDYVSQHLLPRLNGFEILMASYAIAHLKLDLVLQDTGYQHNNDKRFNIYLTNSLEKGTYEKRNLFNQALSAEMEQASEVKNDKPVMVMIGNPPYSVSSSNKDPWIKEMIADYKKGLNERKINLDDDFIKFIRLGQHYVHKNESGIMAYITNNIFLGGITHRQMRLCLLKEFDDIYIFNLHGNLYEKDNKSRGGNDENVFDITKGVSINIFVKTGKKQKDELGKVHYEELIDSRKIKFSYLEEANLSSVEWKELQPEAPYYFFVPKIFSSEEEYNQGFSINELFVNGSTGVESQNDSFCISSNKKDIEKHVADLISLDYAQLDAIYSVSKKKSWRADEAKKDVGREFIKENIKDISVFPFDNRFIYYTNKKGFLARPRYKVMKYMFLENNISLIVPRQTTQDWHHIYCSNHITNGNFLASAKLLGAGTQFPLFINEFNGVQTETPIPNFNESILATIKEGLDEQIVPEELFDYIYAVLHSPSYRQRYNEFLKIDFPRIPYPTDTILYHNLVKKGKELRQLHLIDGADNWDCVTGFPVTEGDNNVTEVKYDEAHERVYINKVRYFSDVPKSAWEFYIGGYQPAQKWLKDRKNHLLTGDDVEHYEQIIHALLQTERVMNEIDEIYAQEII